MENDLNLTINLNSNQLTIEQILQAVQDNGGNLVLNPLYDEPKIDISASQILDSLLENQNVNILTDAQKLKLANMVEKEVYSEQETLTNKIWLNGKPIYRKCIESVTSSTSVSQLYFVSDEIETVTDFSILIKRSGGIVENITLPSDYINGRFDMLEKSIFINPKHSYWANKPFYAIVEYTKVNNA